MSYRSTIALILATVPPAVFALHETGFVVAPDVLPPLGWDIALSLAVTSGAVAGLVAILGRGDPLPAAIVGVTAAAGIFGATYGYLFWRETFLHIELIIPLVLGAIPALLLQAMFYGPDRAEP